MLSNAAKYAIRSVLYLAIHDENETIGVKKVAESLEIPQPFLAKLLQQLTRNKLISSIKGPSGGFYLDKTDRKNSVWDIIVCIDGTEKFDQCFMGLSSCGDENPCPVHFTVAPFKEKILNDFKDKNIQQFADEIRLKGRYISLKNLEL